MKSLKAPKAIKASPQGARVLKAIETSINCGKLKPIRPFDLRHLGYVFHGAPSLAISPTFELRMVLDEDTRREVDFCFALHTKLNVGLVVPDSFSHYIEAASE